jgi:hypothetical protein
MNMLRSLKEEIAMKFKRIHQTGDEYYLLGFLSGLKEKIADAVLLYEPTTLK